MSIYSATKAAVHSLARTSADEPAPRNISPVIIETPILDKLRLTRAQLDGSLECRKKLIPLGLIGQLEDVAATVVFLAADASFTTGVEIFVSGGIVDVV